MTVRTENVLLKSLLQQDSEACRQEPPQTRRNMVEISNQNDAWRVVAADGSTSVITCKSAGNLQWSNGLQESNADDQEANSEMLDNFLPDMHDPGVDLSVLNAENETTSKVIAGLKAMILDEPGNIAQKDLKMPIPQTNLHQIFETDKVCMVNLKK
jgi:hypothetical protein